MVTFDFYAFRFLIGLEQPIKIVDTSPNTTLPLVLEELNILITMKKMKVRSNLWILPEPCDQCMAEVDLYVDVEISVVVFQTIARDGTSRIIIWKIKEICKFWARLKRIKNGKLVYGSWKWCTDWSAVKIWEFSWW